MNSSLPEAVTMKRLRSRVEPEAVLIVTAGFEDRASAVLRALKDRIPQRTALVRYTNGVPENVASFQAMEAMCRQAAITPVVVDFEPRKPDDFRIALTTVLRAWLPDAGGRVFVDVSGLPMQGIMMMLAAVREIVPAPDVTVLYAEALTYFPEKAKVMSAKRIRSSRSKVPPPAALSEEMSGNLIPKYFSGSSISFSTCLLLFAGYEKHRSFGVVDELNPAKLVLLFGRPERDEWAWRLEYSKQLHEPLKSSRPTAEETVSTLDPWATLTILQTYYRYLFSDHNLAIAPICSKMQTVATYLFWEQYRDIQVVFPLPVRYLPNEYSAGVGRFFTFSLPRSIEISDFLRAVGKPRGAHIAPT